MLGEPLQTTSRAAMFGGKRSYSSNFAACNRRLELVCGNSDAGHKSPQMNLTTISVQTDPVRGYGACS